MTDGGWGTGGGSNRITRLFNLYRIHLEKDLVAKDHADPSQNYTQSDDKNCDPRNVTIYQCDLKIIPVI